MKELPATENALLLRTDFSDEAAWRAVSEEVQQPVDEFQANVTPISDPEYEGAIPEQLLSAIPPGWNHSFMFIVDQLTLTDPEHPVLVMDVRRERGRTFRAIPRELWGVENNLSLGNMDFEEFADCVEPDGVFRGFH